MTIQEIITNTGIVLGRQDIVDYFYDGFNIGEETYSDVSFLVRIINLVVNELACTYIPLIYEQEVTFYEGRLEYIELEKKPVKILGVYDYSENEVAFIEKAQHIQLKESMPEAVTLKIKYQFVPDEYFEDSEVEYAEKDIPARVIAYGVAAEYCLSQGMFEQAVIHHKRYVTELQELKKPKNTIIKNRSWK